MTYRDMCRRLAAAYDEGEAKAIARRVFETRFGLSLADICCGKADCLPESEAEELEVMTERLASGEPVQYVLGVETFDGREFSVAPGVLIPRPETEELCLLVAKDCRLHAVSAADRRVKSRLRLLDIGTGSGCIAVTLALNVRDAEVTAWDVSPQALEIARANAQKLGASVAFEERDALHPPHDVERWDVIVSNPPYICDKEKVEMERNVLDHEPHLALFVPDSDPQLFYRAIANYALNALKPAGQLWFEANSAYANDTAAMLQAAGYADVMVQTDGFGRPRFIKATRI